MDAPANSQELLFIKKSPHKSDPAKTVGLVLCKNWWNKGIISSIYDDFFVVATWHEYSDGRTTSYEAKSTLGLLKGKEDAEAIYDHHSKK